jgi:hypothetical protein
MTHSTSYCIYDTIMNPWNICMYVCIYMYVYIYVSMYDHGVGGRILKWITQAKCCGSVERMEVAQDTVHWQVSVRMVMTTQVL